MTTTTPTAADARAARDRLTVRQARVLEEVQWHGFDVDEWFRPMDIGGGSGTDHSDVLRALVRHGFIERRHRGGTRRAYSYRLTLMGQLA